MSNIYFEELPQNIFLSFSEDLSQVEDDETDLTHGELRLFIGQVPLTNYFEIGEQHTIRIFRLGEDWIVKTLFLTRFGIAFPVSFSVLANVHFGNFANGPYLKLSRKIRILKKDMSANAVISVSGVRLDCKGGNGSAPPNNSGLFRWRYGRNQDYEIAPERRRGISGFRFKKDPDTEQLVLALGTIDASQYESSMQAHFRLSVGGFALRLGGTFAAEYHFDDALQPVKLFWPAGGASLGYDRRRFFWLTGSGRRGSPAISGIALGSDWVSVTRFKNAEIGYSVGRWRLGTPLEKQICVIGSAERFRWHTGWPDRGADTPEIQLVYESPALVELPDGVAKKKAEIYRGISPGNFTDRSGHSVRFDADWITLSKSRMATVYELKAGESLNLLPPERFDAVDSLVVPKGLRQKPNGNTVRYCEALAETSAYLLIESELQPGVSPVSLEVSFDSKSRHGVPSGDVRISGLILHSRPNGLSAIAADRAAAPDVYEYWRLAPPDNQPITLTIGEDGIRWPEDVFNGWRVIGSSQFETVSNARQIIELSSHGAESSLKVISSGVVRYERAHLGLAYPQLDSALDTQTAKIKKIKIETIKIAEDDDSPWLAVNNGLGDVVFICKETRETATDPFSRKAKDIVDDYVDGNDWDRAGVDLGFGLTALLASASEDDGARTVKYWNELASDADESAVPGLLIDLSSQNGHEPWAQLDWTKGDWRKFEGDSPEIWPAYNKKFNTIIDPYVARWRGHMIRDFRIGFPELTQLKKFPALRKFFEKLEEKIILRYGWFDERGSSWFAELASDEIHFFFEWQNVVLLSIVKLEIGCSASKLVRANGSIEIELPLFEKSRSFKLDVYLSDQGEGLAFEAAGLSEGSSIPWDAKFLRDVPGVESYTLKSITTDLSSVALGGILKLEDDLVTTLGLDTELEAILTIPLTADGEFEIEGRLKNQKPAGINGWSIKVNGIRIGVGGATQTLTILAEVNLGVDGFASADCEVTVIRNGGNLNYELAIKDFTGRLAIGDFSLGLNLQWEDDGAGGRAFYGTGKLYSPLTGSIELIMKIARPPDAPDTYWIGTLHDATSRIPFGRNGGFAGKKEEKGGATFLIGRRVKKSGAENDTLVDALLNPSGSKIFEATKLGDWEAEEWLDKWDYDPRTEFLIGASGMFAFDKYFLKAPDEEAKRTGIMLSSGGFYRIEAHSKFFGLDIDYDLTVDTQEKYIIAGFHAPELTIQNTFHVSGGHVSLVASYGEEWRFGIALGWPFDDLMKPDLTKPDWSRAVTVRWDDAFPLNTFAGGMLAYFSEEKTALGIAVRAGWTRSYERRAGKLVAQAELGIMVGGALFFSMGGSDVQSTLGPAARLIANIDDEFEEFRETPAIEMELAAALLDLIDDAILRIDNDDPEIRVAVYIDIWGMARVRFFGVTLLGVRIDAHALVSMKYHGEIYWAGASARFSVKVRVLGMKHSASATFDIIFIDKPKPNYGFLADANTGFPINLEDRRYVN